MSDRVAFRDVRWNTVPDSPGVYVIYEGDDVIYVGMSGRNGKGNLRNRLRDHCSGQIVNMFAQYLFLARVQFIPPNRGVHHRFSLDRRLGRHVASKTEAEDESERIRIAIRDGVFSIKPDPRSPCAARHGDLRVLCTELDTRR